MDNKLYTNTTNSFSIYEEKCSDWPVCSLLLMLSLFEIKFQGLSSSLNCKHKGLLTLSNYWCIVVSRYFKYFFLKIGVGLEPYYRSFNMFLSLFCTKGVQNKNTKGNWDSMQRWPTKAIDGLSSHRRTVDVDCRLEV